jgi:putative Holliday junction resolvase
MPDRASAVVLGLDFGLRRIGLATGNTITGTAQPLDTLNHDGDPLDALASTIAQWKPDRIIVGLPLAADGGDSAITQQTRAFAAALRHRHPGIAIELHDERYSSRAAEARFASARRAGHARRRDARNLDSMAAAVIVESWLAERMPA